MTATITALPERMQVKIAVDANGCWIWTGALNSRGYGCWSLAGRSQLTHRVAYRLLVGPIPDGLQVDHLCRVTACCNPAHLEPVTAVENLRRARGRVGVTHCGRGHRLTDANTYPRGHRRECRTCRADVNAAYRARISGRAA